MKEELKNTYESLPEEEKDKLKKYEKRGISEIKQKVDQQTGEILSTETNYNSETKRKKGTFGISDPEELIRLCSFNKLRPINKMLVYILNSINWDNEFTFDKSFINTYGEHKTDRFYTDRKYLIDNKYIFVKPGKKNIFTLNVNLIFRGSMYKATELYQEQFGEELSQDSKVELQKIKKKITKLSKEDIKKLISDLQEML